MTEDRNVSHNYTLTEKLKEGTVSMTEEKNVNIYDRGEECKSQLHPDRKTKGRRSRFDRREEC